MYSNITLIKRKNNIFNDFYTEKDFYEDLLNEYFFIYSKYEFASFHKNINLFLQNYQLSEYYGLDNILDYHIDYITMIYFVNNYFNNTSNYSNNMLQILRLENNNLNDYITQLYTYSKIFYR